MDPEKVAYWYFRLNGFLQLENFIIHPAAGGGQRTDADIIGVRFPNRAERFIDDPNDIMQDDSVLLGLSDKIIDVVIAEVKTGPAELNGPWTQEERQNIQRVLAAIGCLSPKKIKEAAKALYSTGLYQKGDLRVRLVAVGSARTNKIAGRYPNVVQLTWREMLSFIWSRFNKYAQQKADVQQWDNVGRQLKELVRDHYDREQFVTTVVGRFNN